MKNLQEKDKVTLFDHTLSWKELDLILDQAQNVINWVDGDTSIISRAFAYNLREYGEMSHKYEEGKNIKYLKFVPLLTYDIRRNLTKDIQKEVRAWAEDLRPTKDKPQGGDNLPYLRTIMEYALTYTRGGK